MYKIAPVVIALALLALTTCAFAQTARYAGMGNAGLAASDDAGAIQFNPANLASLNLAAAPEGKPWVGQAIGTAQLAGYGDMWGLDLAGFDAANQQGIALGYSNFNDGDTVNSWVLGYGAALKSAPLDWGLSVAKANHDAMFDLGLQYRFVQTESAPIKLGFVASDLFDANEARAYSLGVAIPVGAQAVLAADWLDIGDSSSVNVGAEYNMDNAFAIRAGGAHINDHGEFTAGLGYKAQTWKVDLSWRDAAGGSDDVVLLSVGADF